MSPRVFVGGGTAGWDAGTHKVYGLASVVKQTRLTCVSRWMRGRRAVGVCSDRGRKEGAVFHLTRSNKVAES